MKRLLVLVAVSRGRSRSTARRCPRASRRRSSVEPRRARRRWRWRRTAAFSCASRAGSCGSSRTARCSRPRSDADGGRSGRARAARRTLDPELPDEPVRLRLLHGARLAGAQPLEPVHGERRRRGRRAARRSSSSSTTCLARRTTTAARCTSGGREALHRGRATTRTTPNSQT